MDTSNPGAFFDRPNATGQEAALPRGEQDPERFFNTQAFVRQAAGTHGNVGRNTLDSPGIIGWDFSLLKNFNVNEQHRLQIPVGGFPLPESSALGQPQR